jgi:hypothetical protein
MHGWMPEEHRRNGHYHQQCIGIAVTMMSIAIKLVANEKANGRGLLDYVQ